jgi:hypothetical protein
MSVFTFYLFYVTWLSMGGVSQLRVGCQCCGHHASYTISKYTQLQAGARAAHKPGAAVKWNHGPAFTHCLIRPETPLSSGGTGEIRYLCHVHGLAKDRIRSRVHKMGCCISIGQIRYLQRAASPLKGKRMHGAQRTFVRPNQPSFLVPWINQSMAFMHAHGARPI